MMTTYFPLTCLLLASSMLMTGCGGDRLGRKAISGSITLDGQPLDSGSIQFAPQAPQGHASGGIIHNGTYTIAREKGLPPGAYTVRIYSPVESAPPPSDVEVLVPGPAPREATGPRQPPPGTERIPPEYNVQSTQTVTVAADGDNVFDFDIES